MGLSNMEEVWLYQLSRGDVILSVNRNGRNRVEVIMDPNAARHLAHRLLSFAASQHVSAERILTTKEQTNETGSLTSTSH